MARSEVAHLARSCRQFYGTSFFSCWQVVGIQPVVLFGKVERAASGACDARHRAPIGGGYIEYHLVSRIVGVDKHGHMPLTDKLHILAIGRTGHYLHTRYFGTARCAVGSLLHQIYAAGLFHDIHTGLTAHKAAHHVFGKHRFPLVGVVVVVGVASRHATAYHLVAPGGIHPSVYHYGVDHIGAYLVIALYGTVFQVDHNHALVGHNASPVAIHIHAACCHLIVNVVLYLRYVEHTETPRRPIALVGIDEVDAVVVVQGHYTLLAVGPPYAANAFAHQAARQFVYFVTALRVGIVSQQIAVEQGVHHIAHSKGLGGIVVRQIVTPARCRLQVVACRNGQGCRCG